MDRLARLSGRAVLASACSGEMAVEDEQGHSVFTYALLQGLRRGDRNGDGLIDVGELADYVEQLVPSITLKRWGYEQYPMREIGGESFPIATISDSVK